MSTKVNSVKTLIYGCLHTPFQDVAAEAAMLDFIKYWKPNNIIINGDNHDLYAVSKYFKREKRQYSLSEEIDEGRAFNNRLRAAAGKTCGITLNFGNHEFRWEVWMAQLADKFPEAAQIIEKCGGTFDELFGLPECGIVPNRGLRGTYARTMLGPIQVGHFEILRKHSADTEKCLVTDKGISIIASHSHRKGRYYKTLGNGDVLTGIGTGCMCDDSQQTYTEDPNWQVGFVLVEKLVDKDRYFIHDVPIVGGNILWEGRLY